MLAGSPLRSHARSIWRAPRSVLTWKAIGPVWVWLCGVVVIERSLPTGAWFDVAGVILAAATALIWLLGSAVLSARHEAGLFTSATELAQAVRARFLPLISALLFTLLVPILFFLVALAVALAGRLPAVGAWFLWGWMATGGLVLCGFSAAWALVALPAVFLEVGAVAVEGSNPMDLTTRAMSYVRRQPLAVVWSSLLALVAALLGTVAFAALVTLVALGLHAMKMVGESQLGDVRSVWFGLDWTATWEWPILALVPAYFLASVGAGLSRIYLLLRRLVDEDG